MEDAVSLPSARGQLVGGLCSVRHTTERVWLIDIDAQDLCHRRFATIRGKLDPERKMIADPRGNLNGPKFLIDRAGEIDLTCQTGRFQVEIIPPKPGNLIVVLRLL